VQITISLLFILLETAKTDHLHEPALAGYKVTLLISSLILKRMLVKLIYFMRIVITQFVGLLAFLLCTQKSLAQTDSVVVRFFLLGDAGELKSGKIPVLDWLSGKVNWDDEKNIAVFIGDNIYPDGLPDEGDPDFDYTKKVIDYELGLVQGKKGRAFFVPGNHDWKGGKIGGWERIMNQVNYINALQAPNIQAWPLNGCPGPIPIEINEKVVLVMMDSQWFLHIHDKPGAESACEARTIDEFTSQLNEIVATHQNQLLILVMHHPMYTYGVHGGAYGLKQHIFPFADAIKGLYIPLPGLGSVYPIARGLFGSLQDTYHPLYRNMINEIEQVLKKHPNPVTVAGHEHSMQLIIKDSIPHIVSGSAAKLTRLREGKNSLFAKLDYGFAMLEVRKSGKVEVKFFDLQSTDLNTPLFAKELKTITPVTPVASVDTLLPVIGNIQVVAGPNLRSSGYRRFFWGENYRKEWKQTVSVPMLDLGTEQGGLKPLKQEGAIQTKALRLADKTGKEWSLRAIEKFPEAVIPSDLRISFADAILDNGFSGSYPYASLSTPILEMAAGIPTVKRKLVYIPDDPRLDRFRNGFKNSLAILEEREPTGVGKTYSTEDLVYRLAKDIDDHVDQKAVLTARLMDNFIMDFDRHDGQWQWATKDTGKGKLYYPIPREHDQAFFVNEGFLSAFLGKPWFIPQIQGFKPKASNIKTFNKTARNFDRFFLTELSEEDWKQAIDTFLAQMNDAVIEKALQQQPKEILQLNASNIVGKLKNRRKYFRNEMLSYYRFISKTVNIVGSNQRELFTVTKRNDGKVLVVRNKIEKNGAVSSEIYRRLFEPQVTKELRIYALEDNDSIVVSGDHSKIKLRIIGGPGKDHFVNNGAGKKVQIYDATFEENIISGKPGFVDRRSADPEVNRYSRTSFKYDYVDPGSTVEYNADDGVKISLSLELFKQGFRKEPYGMRQFIQFEKGFHTGSNSILYESNYIKAIRNMDLIVRADIKGPDFVTNFFGIGNNTVFDESKPGNIEYYRTHYNMGNISVLVGKQLQSWMRVGIGPAFQYLTVQPQHNNGKLLADAAIAGYDNGRVYSNKTYLGAEGQININSKNNTELPTRGALLNAYARQLFGLNASSKSVLQTGLDIRIFMSFVPQTKIVFATRFGMGRNFGHYEFPQAQYLGGTENLRGYRRQRFAGRGMFFNNSELRFKISDFTTYIFSGSVGVLGFHDIGRVWADGETSGRWHNGYGAGIWVAPITRIIVVGSLGFSKEERALPMMTFGFQF
jgi:hypothetical protein